MTSRIRRLACRFRGHRAPASRTYWSSTDFANGGYAGYWDYCPRCGVVTEEGGSGIFGDEGGQRRPFMEEYGNPRLQMRRGVS